MSEQATVVEASLAVSAAARDVPRAVAVNFWVLAVALIDELHHGDEFFRDMERALGPLEGGDLICSCGRHRAVAPADASTGTA